MKFRSSTRDNDTTPAPSGGGARPGTDSFIAVGTVVDGDCNTTGTLRIDGRVTGSVRARQLTVGSQGRVEGDVSGPDGGPAEDGVVIDGHVNGSISAPRVEIGKGGSVGDGLRVEEAAIRGRVIGSVVARTRLVLEETAVVEGNVTAPRIAVREGGRVSGTIRIGDAVEVDEGASGQSSARLGPTPSGSVSGPSDEWRPGKEGGASGRDGPRGGEEDGRGGFEETAEAPEGGEREGDRRG